MATRLVALAVAAALIAAAGPHSSGADLPSADMLATVEAVFPSGDAVPANLLRMTIRFSRPPDLPVLPRLTLDGAVLAAGQRPFVDQELWSPDRRNLTVLFDPARLKQGLAAQAAFGAVLRPGQTIALLLDGMRLRQWRVEQAASAGPQPGRWLVHPPPAGSRLELTVDFDTAIDALDGDMIGLAGPNDLPVAGEAEMAAGERRWVFVPAAPWHHGRYRLVVSPALEDAAGNAVGLPFEQLHATGVAPPLAAFDRPFAIE